MSAAVVRKKNNKKISKLQQQAHATHFYILHIVTNFHSVFACLFLHSQSQAERQVYTYICIYTYLVHMYIIYMYICMFNALLRWLCLWSIAFWKFHSMNVYCGSNLRTHICTYAALLLNQIVEMIRYDLHNVKYIIACFVYIYKHICMHIRAVSYESHDFFTFNLLWY